mgnify:CR=1 FL=1
MPKSYVDEITVRYLMKEGYLILKGIWFLLAREKTGKKISGWSDIDIFAVKPKESTLIIQCKSFSGTEKSEKVVERVLTWFNNAEEFLKNSDYKGWVQNGNYFKVFVVDESVKKIEEKLKERGIKVWHYKCILNKLLKKLKAQQMGLIKEKGQGLIGKEEDVLLRIFSDMLRRGLIDEEKLKEECLCLKKNINQLKNLKQRNNI